MYGMRQQPLLRHAPVGCTEEAWERMLEYGREPRPCPERDGVPHAHRHPHLTERTHQEAMAPGAPKAGRHQEATVALNISSKGEKRGSVRKHCPKLSTLNASDHKGPKRRLPPNTTPMRDCDGRSVVPRTHPAMVKATLNAAEYTSVLPCYAVFSRSPRKQKGKKTRGGKIADKDGPSSRRHRRKGKASRRWRPVATARAGGAVSNPFTPWQ